VKTIPLEETNQNLAQLSGPLGIPTRLRILPLLAQRDCVCGEVVDDLPLAQATVSQHLKVLKEAGLIVGRIEGPTVCYCLAPGALNALPLAVARLAMDTGERENCC
jgi:ArsR family transcriptional regulator